MLTDPALVQAFSKVVVERLVCNAIYHTSKVVLDKCSWWRVKYQYYFSIFLVIYVMIQLLSLRYFWVAEF